jgi:SAM-dependent methyltransferase
MDRTETADGTATTQSDQPETPATARGPKDKHKKTKGKKGKKQTMADKADKYVLYQKSVQAPDIEVKTLKKLYKDTRGKANKPRTLREDFSGTGAISCEWAKLGKDKVAYAVDLDPETHQWGTEHNLSALKPKEQERVHWILGDVREAHSPPVDLICACNFSYFIFKTRDELREYFKAAYDNLNDDGIFVCDIFGGHEVLEDNRQEVTRHKGFRYIWDQHKLNPITHDYLFYIHFAFKDGSRLDKAFEYDWRFWSIPEVRELMLEAGFERADCYWEGTDKDGEGNGKYKRQMLADADPAWLAYIVGVK